VSFLGAGPLFCSAREVTVGSASRVRAISKLRDCIAFLGPLGAGWSVIGDWGIGRRFRYQFVHSATGDSTHDDPRLSAVPKQAWNRIDRDPEPDDPEIYDFFCNAENGDVSNSDPRLLPDSLAAVGITVDIFTLV